MEKCIICGKSTSQTAPVYAGIPITRENGRREMTYTRHDYPCCMDCVTNAHRRSGGLPCYAALQLLWFVTARNGFASPLGLAAAAVSVLALLRLIQLLLRRYWPLSSRVPGWIMGTVRYPQEASELVLERVREDTTFAGMRLITQAEYARTHGTGS